MWSFPLRRKGYYQFYRYSTLESPFSVSRFTFVFSTTSWRDATRTRIAALYALLLFFIGTIGTTSLGFSYTTKLLVARLLETTPVFPNPTCGSAPLGFFRSGSPILSRNFCVRLGTTDLEPEVDDVWLTS
jgi:hypothetical protein